jgi:hypothetical protein
MSRYDDAIGTNEDVGGGTREWHGRDVRRRARYDARVAANRARARSGKDRSRVRPARGPDGLRRDKTAFRIPTRQFGKPSFSELSRRPVPAVDARVDLARTFVGGFVSVPASAGAFPGSVSEGDISGAFLRRNGPRESTEALFATSVRWR